MWNVFWEGSKQRTEKHSTCSVHEGERKKDGLLNIKGIENGNSKPTIHLLNILIYIIWNSRDLQDYYLKFCSKGRCQYYQYYFVTKNKTLVEHEWKDTSGSASHHQWETTTLQNSPSTSNLLQLRAVLGLAIFPRSGQKEAFC